jgi:tetratricopeptide (TPR) repeat protein
LVIARQQPAITWLPARPNMTKKRGSPPVVCAQERTRRQRCAAVLSTFAVAAALAGTLPGSLESQDLRPPTKRPKLLASSDSNDARAYLELGNSQFEHDPRLSADAFYWAGRLDPRLAEAFYGRRAALLGANLRLYGLLLGGPRQANRNRDLRRLDSLYLRALTLDPFLNTRLDKPLFVRYFRESITGGDPSANTGELNFAINEYLRRADFNTKAWVASSDGDYSKALALYADAMKPEREKAYYRIERGRIFGRQGMRDSAIAEFTLALDELRKRDAKDLVVLYNSKAVLEHSIGTLHEQSDNLSGAREAYGLALQEDLSYYPAHLRLGQLALSTGDSATALSELALAVETGGNEPSVRVAYGFALAAAGKIDEAAVQLQKAIEIEPLYALPYVLLGQVYERKGDAKQALATYEAFLARAARNHPQRKLGEGRLTEIKEFLKGIPGDAKPGRALPR